MSIYLTTLPSMPKWRIKVRTLWYNGHYIATATIPVSTGMVTLNKEHPEEHVALHRLINTLNEFVERLHFSRNELGKLN